MHAAVIALYLALACVITYPLVTQLSTRLLGHPFGDSYEYLHHIWWIKTALQTGQNPFFFPNILYPDGGSAALLWGVPLQSFPAWAFAFVMPLPTAYNLALLLTLALNGWAMWRLVYTLTQRHDAALVAGAIFLTYPAFHGQLGAGHVGLLVLWPAVLFTRSLVLLATAQPRRRDIPLAAAWFALSAGGSPLLLIYVVAPLLLIWLPILVLRKQWRGLQRIVITLILGGAIAAPFLIPAFIEAASQPNTFELEGDVRYSAPLIGIAASSFYHPLYDEFTFNRAALGVEPFELASYAGIITVTLALFAAVQVRASRRWLLVAALAWLLSLGPLLKLIDTPTTLTADGRLTFVTLPGALLQAIPLLNIARTPARFNFAVGLALAVMAGYGAAWLLARVPRRLVPPFAIVIALLAVLDHQWWWPLPTIDAIVPAPITALADDTSVRAVFNVPWQHLLTDKEALFLQTGHEQPIIAGHVARQTPLDPARAYLLQETLDPTLLHMVGVDVILLHKEWDADSAARIAGLRARFGEPFYEDSHYAAFRVVPPESVEPPDILTVEQIPTLLTERASIYLYLPEDRGVLVQTDLRPTPEDSSQPRTVLLLVDGEHYETFTLIYPAQPSWWLPLSAGFHTIALALEPGCPVAPQPLTCAAVAIDEFSLEVEATS